MRTPASIILIVAAALSAGAEWSLVDHPDSVLMCDSLRLSEYHDTATGLRSNNRGYFLPTATLEDGNLRPYATGMEVNGELREGQMLLTPDQSISPSWVEFVLHDCTYVMLQYGLCDGSNAEGTKLTFFFYPAGAPRGEPVAQTQISLTKREWSTETVDLPGGDLFVRVKVEFVGHEGKNWSALVCSGDGSIGTRDEARELSPLADQLKEMPTELEPDDVHVNAREGYDILFLGDEPYINYASKGHWTGTQAVQKQAGINLFYAEGANLTAPGVWPEDADRPQVTADSSTFLNMYICQREKLPYKTAVGIAHCVYYLPEWLVEREDLGFEEHYIRREDPRHTCFIKPKTLEWSKKALNGWASFFAPHTSIFVLGQEDQIDQWDDQSDEAKTAFRAWLRAHFDGNFTAFSEYVGGVEGCTDFADAPYLDHFASEEAYGYPRRAAYLKYLWQVEAYTEYLVALKKHCRSIAPEVPVTQRYVISPASVAISEMGNFDYDYMYGHLSTEGAAGRYGSGKKIWNGIYGYCGLLPTPRGGSIGKCKDLQIRRTGMTEEEWETNAWTLLANGCTGYEQSPFLPRWGERWNGAALVDDEGELNEQGRLSAKVMGEVTSVAPYCKHYDSHQDVAVFHDSAWQSRYLGQGLSQSKVGIYTMIREMGYHPDPVTIWEMTPEHLATKKVLVLAGSVPIAPEVQEAIRGYVRNGGTLLAVYSAAGQGFPGCNGWEFTGEAAQAAVEMSFDHPPARVHLGDVVGIVSGGGSARHASLSNDQATVSLDAYNALVHEGRWANQEVCCARLDPAADAQVLARFEDGRPAAIQHTFGEGVAVTVGVDLGAIAANIVQEVLYTYVDHFLEAAGCRKAYDTGSYYVEAGMWHNDSGQKLLILVNHDTESPRSAPLPDGTTITIEPWRAHVWTSDKGSL